MEIEAGDPKISELDDELSNFRLAFKCLQDKIDKVCTVILQSYDLVSTVLENSCSREQLFANGSGYLDTAADAT